MSTERIKEILESLLEEENKDARKYGEEEETLEPATDEMIAQFRKEAEECGVPAEVIEQLVEYYRVSGGEEYFDGYHMYACDSEYMFEWWEDYGALWLGGRDDTVYRWVDGKFCLGDGGNNSYGEEYEFPTLVGLLEKIVGEMLENREDDEDGEDDE